MEKVLTVVIPSFNVEKYLRQTLESLRNEEILEDVEVLIVDDGSTDGTAKIGKEYEKRYPQTYRVISKTNGGHGSTINCGIEQSRGTFFKVVDGDDWVNTEALIEVVRRLKTCGADYVVTDYCEVNDKTKEQVRKQFPALDVCREIGFENAAEKVQIPMHALIITLFLCGCGVCAVSGTICGNRCILSGACLYVSSGTGNTKREHPGISKTYTRSYPCDFSSEPIF